MRYAFTCRYAQGAFLVAVPIGALAGLIGVGGGEFRLPVLTQAIGFPARTAVPLNLLISFATLAFAAIARNPAVPASGVLAHVPEVIGLALGGIAAAIVGAQLFLRMSERRLIQVIAALLAALGVLLIFEAFVPFGEALLAAEGPLLRALAGTAIGLGIGAVSSLLGVAGGELLIPALVYVFGADIRIAGTASLLISLVIVAAGLWRYHLAAAVPLCGGAPRIAAAMSAGSLAGAALGAYAVAVSPAALLKVVLGVVLLLAAAKTARHRHVGG